MQESEDWASVVKQEDKFLVIEYTDKSIFEVGCQAIVCPVNCVGVMGKGLALDFKRKYYWMFSDYKAAVGRGGVALGKVFTYTVSKPIIICFPTKEHWRDKSNLAAIRTGLLDLESHMGGIASIAIPRLGCGLGGLSWKDVKPLIEAFAARLPEVKVVLFDH